MFQISDTIFLSLWKYSHETQQVEGEENAANFVCSVLKSHSLSLCNNKHINDENFFQAELLERERECE